MPHTPKPTPSKDKAKGGGGNAHQRAMAESKANKPVITFPVGVRMEQNIDSITSEPRRESTALGRSSLEAYAAIAITIVAVVFTMTWWIKCILLLALGYLLADISFRSRWTITMSAIQKSFITLLAIAGLIWMSWKPIREQYKQEHTAPSTTSSTKPEKTATVSISKQHETKDTAKVGRNPKHAKPVGTQPIVPPSIGEANAQHPALQKAAELAGMSKLEFRKAIFELTRRLKEFEIGWAVHERPTIDVPIFTSSDPKYEQKNAAVTKYFYDELKRRDKDDANRAKMYVDDFQNKFPDLSVYFQELGERCSDVTGADSLAAGPSPGKVYDTAMSLEAQARKCLN